MRCWAMRLNVRPDQRTVYSLLVAVFLLFKDKILLWRATDGEWKLDVRYWHLTDIPVVLTDVRFRG
jgi:hypothetical protein